MPATADLLAVIASLPRGAVVLPGLDTEADEATWRAISVDPSDPDFPLAQSHPQFGLARLLRRLRHRSPAGAAMAGARRRRHRAGARAPWSAVRWRPRYARTRRDAGEALPPQAVEGLSMVETGTPEEEARVIALIMRQTLERDDLTAALVTPDRALARRVAAELQRWDIAVDDSGGQPLAQTAPAVFLRLVARMAVEELAPVPLLAALKHPLAAGGQAPSAVPPRRARAGAGGIARASAGTGDRRPAARGRGARRHASMRSPRSSTPWKRRSARSTRLLDAGAVSLAEILAAHVAAAEALAASDAERGAQRLWVGDAGEALAAFLADLAQSVRDDLPIAAAEYPDLFDALMDGHVVRPRWGRHPRLAIWGPLEARLQRADVMILGGLNEETWPPKAHASPWMSRPMMQAFGLPLPERRIGLSAHDFCQAFSAAEVWLTRARRKEGAPTVPCRWLLRLRAALRDSAWAKDNARRERQLLHWQRLLDAPDAILPTPAPSPAPPLEARPRRLSVTQVETWIRDPYAIYARHILRLQPSGRHRHAAGGRRLRHLRPCGAEQLSRRLPGELPPDAYERLLEHGREALGELLERPLVRAFWWPRFERIARWFVDNERARRCRVVATASEVTGKLALDRSGRDASSSPPRPTGSTAWRTARSPSSTTRPASRRRTTRCCAARLRSCRWRRRSPRPAASRASSPHAVAALEYWRLRGDDEDGEQSSERVRWPSPNRRARACPG